MSDANRNLPTVRRRGVALVLALVPIGLVGAAIAGVGALVYFELDRTRNAEVDAQLRALLNAGRSECQRLLVAGTLADGDTSVELPAGLRDRATVTIRVTGRRNAEVLAQVDATLDDRRASQTLTFALGSDATWRVTRAALHDRGA